MQQARCQAVTAAGKPCKADHWKDGYCRWHHPDLGAQRQEWSAKGGHNRSNERRALKRLPKTLRDVEAALLRALAAVEDGSLEPSRATAMGNLARAIVSVSDSGRLEERVSDLETRAHQGDGRWAS